MIHLAWPWLALLLPLPWLLYRWRPVARPGGTALFMPTAAALSDGGAVTGGPDRQRWLFGAIWLLLVLAAMRPQWLGQPLPAPTQGRRIMLAIDVSGSMATQDMAGDRSRLQVVQQVAGQFIDGRRGDQIGLILFGTHPYVQAPLTTDVVTVHRFLDEAVVGVAGSQTAIGDAIGMAIKRLRDTAATGSRGHPALVLLTDGESNAGIMPPLQAARLAAEVGLRIYTIGIGADAASNLFGLGGGDNDLDETTLRAIARLTGGQYFRATDASALQSVYRQIDRLEPSAARQQWVRPTTEWFTWPLALALLLSVPATLLGARRWT